jgi:hypothetical protein
MRLIDYALMDWTETMDESFFMLWIKMYSFVDERKGVSHKNVRIIGLYKMTRSLVKYVCLNIFIVPLLMDLKYVERLPYSVESCTQYYLYVDRSNSGVQNLP